MRVFSAGDLPGSVGVCPRMERSGLELEFEDNPIVTKIKVW